MFPSQTLARRIERAEMGQVVAAARAAARRVPAVQLIIREMNGGAAVFVERGAPFNKVVGAGFEGVPAADVLDRLEQDFAERQAPLQFAVATLADPALMRALTARGYLLTGFEHVLGLPLDPSRRFDSVTGRVLKSVFAWLPPSGGRTIDVATRPAHPPASRAAPGSSMPPLPPAAG
jgi:hypothetical protein